MFSQWYTCAWGEISLVYDAKTLSHNYSLSLVIVTIIIFYLIVPEFRAKDNKCSHSEFDTLTWFSRPPITYDMTASKLHLKGIKTPNLFILHCLFFFYSPVKCSVILVKNWIKLAGTENEKYECEILKSHRSAIRQQRIGFLAFWIYCRCGNQGLDFVIFLVNRWLSKTMKADISCLNICKWKEKNMVQNGLVRVKINRKCV